MTFCAAFVDNGAYDVQQTRINLVCCPRGRAARVVHARRTGPAEFRFVADRFRYRGTPGLSPEPDDSESIGCSRAWSRPSLCGRMAEELPVLRQRPWWHLYGRDVLHSRPVHL